MTEMKGDCFLVGIGGGIGCGKSVVARICRLMGYKVYDCDLRARELMTTDFSLRNKIESHLGKESFNDDGSLNKSFISSVIFCDVNKRNELDRLVHKSVKEDFKGWVSSQTGSKILFVESALIFTSGLNEMLDEIWIVESPMDQRIKRICRRDSLSCREVEKRIESQNREVERHKGEKIFIVKNNDNESLYCQINERIKLLREK